MCICVMFAKFAFFPKIRIDHYIRIYVDMGFLVALWFQLPLSDFIVTTDSCSELPLRTSSHRSIAHKGPRIKCTI
jgi:hypothetical protein